MNYFSALPHILEGYANLMGEPGPDDRSDGAVAYLPALDDMAEAEAYALQEATIRQLCVRWSRRRVGYKVSLTNPIDQGRVGTHEPTFGELTDKHLLQNNAKISLSQTNSPLLEPEILMRVNRVGAEGDGFAMDAFEVEIAAGIEIPVSRFQDWWPPGQNLRLSAISLIADNSAAGYVVLGSHWRRMAVLPEIEVEIAGPGGTAASGTTAAVMGSPVNSLLWLNAKLADQGKSLRCGDLISTGTLTRPLRPEVGTYVASFSDGLGDVEVSFT